MDSIESVPTTPTTMPADSRSPLPEGLFGLESRLATWAAELAQLGSDEALKTWADRLGLLQSTLSEAAAAADYVRAAETQQQLHELEAILSTQQEVTAICATGASPAIAVATLRERVGELAAGRAFVEAAWLTAQIREFEERSRLDRKTLLVDLEEKKAAAVLAEVGGGGGGGGGGGQT